MKKRRFVKIARYNGYVIGWYIGNRAFLFDALTDRAIRKFKNAP
jgi:hypothetical protein